MNRRSFLRNLAIGVAALPLAVKAIGHPKQLVQYGQPRLWVSEPKQKILMCSNPSGEWSHNPEWDHAQYRVHFLMNENHSGPWFDGNKWRVIDNRANKWKTL